MDLDFPQYFHHPNYKSLKKRPIDFQQYINYVLKNHLEKLPSMILSIFPNFNNIPRLYARTDYKTISTTTVHYSDELLYQFFKIQFDRYQCRQ